MERRNFVKTIAIGGAVLAVTPLSALKIPNATGTSTVPLTAPLVHVRHGLYNPVLASKLTSPIAGNWVYSFSSDIFARDGVKAEIGDENPVSVSIFVGDSNNKKLIHFILEDNECKQLVNSSLKTTALSPNTSILVHESSQYLAQVFRCDEELKELQILDGEHFIALLSGKVKLGRTELSNEQAVFVKKHESLPLSVSEESQILVATRLT